MFLNTRHSLLTLVIISQIAGQAAGQTYSWTGAQTVHWRTAQNWDPQAVPGVGSASGAIAYIGPGPGYVDLGNGDPVVLSSLGAFRTLRIFGRLQTGGLATLVDVDYFHNGTVDGVWNNGGTIRFEGTSGLWSGGKIVGGIVENTGTITLGATGPGRQGTSNLSDTSFRNNGNAILQGTLALFDDAEAVNNATMTMVGNGQVQPGFLEPSGGGHLRNMGTLHATAGNQINTGFLNLGTIQSPGHLTLRGFMMIIQGNIAIPSGGVVDVYQSASPGSLTPSLGCNVTGEGTMRLLYSPHRIFAPTVVNIINPSGGFIIDNDHTVTLLSTLTNSGHFRWPRGFIAGEGTIVNTLTGRILWGVPGGTNAHLYSRLTNNGEVHVVGGQRIGDPGIFENDVLGGLEMAGSIIAPNGAAPGKVVCRGLIWRSEASSATGSSIAVPLEMENEGQIEVLGGTIAIGATTWGGVRSRWNGNTEVVLGPSLSAKVVLTDGVHQVLSGRMLARGRGTMEVGPSSILVVEGGSVANVLDDDPGSEFLVTGTLGTTRSGSEPFFINNGRMRVAGTVDSGNSIFFNDEDGDLYVNHGMLLGLVLNHGIAFPSSNMNIGSLPTSGNRDGYFWNDEGVVRLGPNTTIWLNHPLSTLDNTGLVEKVGTGQGVIRGLGSFSNDGVVYVRQGALSIESEVKQLQGRGPDLELTGGTWMADAGAQLQIQGTVVGIGPFTEVAGSTETLPWLPQIRRIAGAVRFRGNSMMPHPVHVRGGGMTQIDGPAQVNAPGGVTNGEEEDILSEIIHVWVGARSLQPRLITPILHNHARLIPGGHETPGPFNLTGDLVLYSTGRILVELGGLQPILEHDQVSITGGAQLAGTLDLSLIDEFIPSLGQQFVLLSATSGISGAFGAVLQPPDMPSGLTFEVSYTNQEVIATVVSHCYANCDGSAQPPILNIADFSCFLQKFAAGDPYANCDGSTQEPVLNVADFSCFLQKFAAGCP
jgi:hypothetical protein